MANGLGKVILSGLSLLVASLLQLAGQSYSYMQQFSVDEGLPHTDVSSILQDEYGYIWIGTYSGLCRYDGNHLDCWDMSNSILQSSRIRSLFLSGSLLYIGTENGGITIYDVKSGKFLRNIDVPGNFVNCLFGSYDGRSVWACTNEGLLQVNIDGDNCNTSSYSLQGYSYAGCAVRADELLVSSSGNLGVFSKQDGFHKVQEGLFINSFLKFSDDKVILAASQGTFVYDIKAEEVWRLNQYDSRSAFLSDDGKCLMVCTAHHGVLEYDQNLCLSDEVVPWNTSSQGADIELSTIFCDDAGVMWLGTNGCGCFRSTRTGRAFKLYLPFYEGGCQIVTMFVDSADRLWVASRDGRVSVLQRDAFTQVAPSSLYSLESMPISSIYEDRDGNILLGTWNKGVLRINKSDVERACEGKSFQLNRLAELPSQLSVYKFAEDSFGRFWITTDNGVYRSRTSDIHSDWDNLRYSRRDTSTISDNFTTDILVDGRNVWVGTRASLNRITLAVDGSVLKTERVYVREKGNAGEFVSFIHKSSDGSLWVSVLGLGLAKMTSDDNGYEFKVYNKSVCPDFVNNEFESLLEDKHGNFWIGGFGITRFSPETGTARVYTRKDGLQSNSFKIWDSATFLDGRMAFGGINGLNIFFPDDIKNNESPVNVRITSIGINGENAVESEKPLKLTHAENNLTFGFSSMSYSVPEQNRYKYMMKGLDDVWHYTDGSNPGASYLNLNPGRYTFVVYGSNSDGVWGAKPARLALRILPPWYLSLTSKICYLIALMGIVAAFVRFKKRRIEERHKNEIAKKLAEEQRERNEEELKFHTDFLHEIRTPLTLITTPVEELLLNPNLGKGTLSRLHLVEKSVNILQKHIESVTDLRKYDNGKVSLHVVEVDFARFAEEICLLFQPLASSRGYEFNVKINHLEQKVFIDKDGMEKVILNLMSNAVKYSPERGGKIDVSLTSTDEGALFSVSNLGIGILPEDLPYVFDRFRQGKNNDRGGMGIGLSISKSVVLSHSGKIWAESVPGGVTAFYVLIPYGCAHFKAEDIDRGYRNSDYIANYDSLAEFMSPEVGVVSGVEREKSVLIADDSKELSGYLSQLLSSKYNVLAASDGERAYEMAISEQPDLVLTDVVMPKLNGLELCRRIKENNVTSHIPVILISARDLPTYKMEGYQMLADDYITKPFHAALLLSRIDNLIRQRECMKQAFHTEVNVEPSTVTVTSVDEKFIRSCIKDIEEHIGEVDYGVDDLCQNIGYSRPQLYRKIKSITGMSAIQFLRSIRLKRAAQLLSSGGGMNVAQVMTAVGFSNISYFSKIFFAEFGVLPKDYKG